MFNGRTTVESDEVIDDNGFWGAISVSEFQKSRGIPLQVPLELVKEALVYAIFSLEIDLKEVENHYQNKGIHHVKEIEGSMIGGTNFHQFLYRKAVFARAKNELLPEFFTLSARELHEKRDLVSEQKKLQAEVTMAIRSLKNKPRGSVMLI